MDVTDHRYRSFDETLLYCYRVAGVVGVMMALVMGVRGIPVSSSAPPISASASS